MDRRFERATFLPISLCLYERECRSVFRARRGINALIRWLIYRPALLSPLIRFSGSRRGLLDSMVYTICRSSSG